MRLQAEYCQQHQKLEEARSSSSLESAERAWFCQLLHSVLSASRTVREINVCCLRPPDSWQFVLAAIGTNAGVQLDCGIKNKEGGAICLSPAMTVHLIQLILSHLILTFNSYLLLLGGNYYYVCFTKQVTELQGSWEACSPSYIWLLVEKAGHQTKRKKKKIFVLFLRLPLRRVEESTKHLKMRLQEEATQLPLSRGTKRRMGALKGEGGG